MIILFLGWGIDCVEIYLPFNVLEDVALIVSSSDLEGQGCVVALQHSCVVVEDGQLAPRVAQEAVGAAGVVHVVHSRSDQGGHLINWIQTLLCGKTKACETGRNNTGGHIDLVFRKTTWPGWMTNRAKSWTEHARRVTWKQNCDVHPVKPAG